MNDVKVDANSIIDIINTKLSEANLENAVLKAQNQALRKKLEELQQQNPIEPEVVNDVP